MITTTKETQMSTTQNADYVLVVTCPTCGIQTEYDEAELRQLALADLKAQCTEATQFLDG